MGYEDMAKEDVVLYVQYGGRTYLEKPEVVTGEMEHFNVKGTEKYMTVGGEKYKADELETNARTEVVKFDVTECDKANGVQFETSYNFYLDDYGNVIAFEEVEAAAKNYALVLDSAFSTNMLNTDAQVKVLLPDGTEKTYQLNWSASVKNWKDANETTEQATEQLKTFLGTDDGRAGSAGVYPAAGAAAGNLIAYSINDDDKMTIDLPALDVGKVVDGSHAGSDYSDGKFFQADHETLDANVSKGDVEIDTSASKGGDPVGTYGIDADTIVYYYNGKDGSVAVGYDNMAKLIDKNGVLAETGKKIIDAGTNTNGTANGEVKVSVVDLYKSDVANVVVLYTSQAKFGNEDYVFVMPEFDVYNDYFYYTVIHEDGTMEEVKSEENLRNDLKGTDGIVCTIDMDSKNLASFNTTPSRVVEGFVKVTSSRYVNVYTDATTNNAIQNPGKDNEWLDMTKLQSPVRLANKNDELIYDIDNTDVDDETATGTTFQDGQYGYVVYDEDNIVKAAFIVKSYLTEDPTGSNEPGKPDDRELVVTVDDDYNIVIYNPNNSSVSKVSDAIVDALEDAGYTDVNVTVKNGSIDEVTAKDGKITITFNKAVEAADSQSELDSALKSAQSGDTVYVGSGTFELNQPVSGLTIIGNGKTVIENNVVDTDGQSAGIYVKGTNDVTISGVNFTGGTGEFGIVTATGYTGDLTVEDCTFDGLNVGVYVNKAGNVVVKDCVFDDCTAHAIGADAFDSLKTSGNDYSDSAQDVVVYRASVNKVDCKDGTVETFD